MVMQPHSEGTGPDARHMLETNFDSHEPLLPPKKTV